MHPRSLEISVTALLLVAGCFNPEPFAVAGGDEATEEAPDEAPGEAASTSGAEPDPATTAADEPSDVSTSGPPATTGAEDEGTSTGSDVAESSSTGGLALDCAGVPGGDAVVDECGECNGAGGPCWGCTVPAASNYDPVAEVDDGTCSCAPAGGAATDQSNLYVDAGAGSQDQWQSFTAGIPGGLTRIDLGVSSPLVGSSSPGTIRVYRGEGIGGTELHSQQVVFEEVYGVLQEFPLEEPLPLIVGGVYTIRFSVPAINVGWVDLGPNLYDRGRSSFGEERDYIFRTVVVPCE